MTSIIFNLINGLTNNEFAEQINISPHTVRTHRKNIYSKLNVHNVLQMAEQISKMKTPDFKALNIASIYIYPYISARY